LISYLKSAVFHGDVVINLYTGSIGLGNVVNKLGRMDLINDIVNVPLPPLTRAQARELILRLVSGLKTKGCDLDLDEKTIQYILEKDSGLMPYYIQIIVDELQAHCQETGGRIGKRVTSIKQLGEQNLKKLHSIILSM